MTVEFHMVKQKICIMAANYSWKHIKTQEWCMNFEKGEGEERVAMNVYWNRQVAMNIVNPYFTVQTALAHPRKGKTQLNRKSVSMLLLEKIFDNPRVHTHNKIKAYIKK